MFLFLLVSVLLIATYLLIPSATEDVPQAASLHDFNFPDNSIGKPIPRLYGMGRLNGNIMWYGNLTAVKIEQCQ